MSRGYSVPLSFTYTNAGGDFEIVYIAPGDDKPCKLRGLLISQSSEVGDAQEENIRISILRLTATVTASSGGSAPTPTPMDSADTAAGFTARAGDSVVATTTGSAITCEEFGWNERATPLERWWLDDRFAFKVKQGEALVIRGQSTVADDITMQVTAFIEEE
jgi:hypothetical protein